MSAYQEVKIFFTSFLYFFAGKTLHHAFFNGPAIDNRRKT